MALKVRDANDILQNDGADGLRQKWDGAAPGKRNGGIATSNEQGEMAGKHAKKPEQTHAQVLIEIATSDGVELFHSPDGTGYADIHVNGHRETWPLKSRGFDRFLRRAYYEKTGGAPNAEAMSSARGVIEARAQFDGMKRPVFVRVADLRRYLR
jgi:hypothetical protein